MAAPISLEALRAVSKAARALALAIAGEDKPGEISAFYKQVRDLAGKVKSDGDRADLVKLVKSELARRLEGC